MVMKASRAVEAILNELGSGLSEGLTPLDIVSAAYSQVLGMREGWSWAEGTARLDTVAGSKFVALPTDFGALCRYREQDIYMKILPDDQYLQITANGTAAVGGVLLARLDRDNLQLEFLEEFTEDEEGKYWIVYEREALVIEDSATELPLPAYMHPLFLNLVRAMARGWEESDESDWNVLVERVRKGPSYAAAVQADIRRRVKAIRGRMDTPMRGRIGLDVIRFGNYGSVIAVDGTEIPPVTLL